ncbi:MAG: DUF3750 domain-containing protein [Gammaproteobacteria bacterium]|nr:DUF3750 domain-containing protein [Gammaproteobacteria bacterium]MDH3466665.1 DUF3750 domain-containing protein [Gammaproteobacteria bacterium]
MEKWIRRGATVLAVVLIGPLVVAFGGDVKLDADWRTADRSPAGIAPAADTEPRAVVQVYAARAFNWRGLFAVHTWLAVKPAGAGHYTVHQVVGWRAWHGRPVVVSHNDQPDRKWYGQAPQLLLDLRGETAAAVIDSIHAAVRDYPYANRYTLWPGPNSNTFTAFVGRRVPELRLHLPATAIGKDFLSNGAVFASAPSGTGYQLSIYGLLGATAAWHEGFELNVLGLTFGIDLRRPAIKFPGLGRVGMATG